MSFLRWTLLEMSSIWAHLALICWFIYNMVWCVAVYWMLYPSPFHCVYVVLSYLPVCVASDVVCLWCLGFPFHLLFSCCDSHSLLILPLLFSVLFSTSFLHLSLSSKITLICISLFLRYGAFINKDTNAKVRENYMCACLVCLKKWPIPLPIHPFRKGQ